MSDDEGYDYNDVEEDIEEYSEVEDFDEEEQPVIEYENNEEKPEEELIIEKEEEIIIDLETDEHKWANIRDICDSYDLEMQTQLNRRRNKSQ